MGLNWARAQKQKKMRERGTLAATATSKTEQNVVKGEKLQPKFNRVPRLDRGVAMSEADVARVKRLRAEYLAKHGK